MAIGPTIETERLILRPPRAEDFDSWCAFHADEDVMRHLGGVQGPELTWRSMCAMTGAWTIEGFSMFSVIEKATGEWVGRLGPWRPYGWPGTEVGWGLVRAAWGKGYASEGAAAPVVARQRGECPGCRAASCIRTQQCRARRRNP